MKGDAVSYDGKLVRWGSAGAPDAELLPGSDFIYQRLHVLERNVLQADAHIEIAELSYNALYGGTTGLTPQALAAEAAALLEANRYIAASAAVTLYLMPDAAGGDLPHRLLVVSEQLLYRGYTLWHKQMRAIITPYEVPFTVHRTGTSLAAHRYAEGYARRKGADVTLVENFQGVLTGAGEYPLFAVAGNEVLTSPFDAGVPESVERRLGIEAAEKAGLILLEQPIERGRLDRFDELFYVTPQGIVSIGSVENRLHPNSMATRIATAMEHIRL